MSELHNKNLWHRRARAQLRMQPLCAMCLAEGKVVAARIRTPHGRCHDCARARAEGSTAADSPRHAFGADNRVADVAGSDRSGVYNWRAVADSRSRGCPDRGGGHAGSDRLGETVTIFRGLNSKGCVLVNWQPRHQQDEEAAGEDSSTAAPIQSQKARKKALTRSAPCLKKSPGFLRRRGAVEARDHATPDWVAAG